MDADRLLGLPWWLLCLLAVAAVAIVIVLAKALLRRRIHAEHLAEAERLAQLADASHEGARTRHEGGA